MEMSLLVLYLLLPFPSVVLGASPYFPGTPSNLPFFTLLGVFSTAPRGNLWVASNASNTCPLFMLVTNSFSPTVLGHSEALDLKKHSASHPIFLVARQLPASSLPELVSMLWSRAKFLLFNIHMLSLLPCGFSSLKNINICNNLSSFKTLSTSIMEGTHLRPLFIITETFEPVS